MFAVEFFRLALPGWRNKFLGQLGSFAKEVLLHLFHQKLLGFGLPGLEPVFVEQHLGVLGPHLPRLSTYSLIDFLSQFSIKRGFIQAGEFPPKFCAFHHSRHGEYCNKSAGSVKLRIGRVGQAQEMTIVYSE